MAGRVLSPSRIAALERRATALKLRKEGYSYAEIAKQCGYKDDRAAAAAIKKQLASIVIPTTEDALKLELERLNELQAAFYPDMRDANPRAAEVVLKAMTLRSTYLGLNDYERRMADAAQAQAILNAQLVDQLFALMQGVFVELGLTEEQMDRAPAVMIEVMKKMEVEGQEVARGE